MGDGRSAAFRIALGGATFAAFAALWYVATSVTHIIPPVYFPAPAEVAQALQQIATRGYADGKLHEHVAPRLRGPDYKRLPGDLRQIIVRDIDARVRGERQRGLEMWHKTDGPESLQ